MTKRKKITAEEKIRIAKFCSNGAVSLNAAAERLGVHQSIVDDWVRLYQTEGIAAFLPRKGNRRYDPALKETAVKDYLSGICIPGFCVFASKAVENYAEMGIMVYIPISKETAMKKIIVTVMLLALLCGCGAQAPAQESTEPSVETTAPATLNIAALYTQLEALGMPEMVELDEGLRLDLYGIRSEEVKQVKVVICTENLRADELWLIEAVDAQAAEHIKTLAEGRIKQKDAESITYSPEQNAIVKKSVVLVEGNFLFFICSPDVDKMVDVVNTALGK